MGSTPTISADICSERRARKKVGAATPTKKQISNNSTYLLYHKKGIKQMKNRGPETILIILAIILIIIYHYLDNMPVEKRIPNSSSAPTVTAEEEMQIIYERESVLGMED